jgi:group I intron endonuclease
MSTSIYHTHFLYRITNILNGKVYIGQTQQSVLDRYQQHLNEAKRSNDRRLCQAINKYGEKNFTVEWIGSAWSQEGANALEEALIAQYDSYRDFNKGYNMTPGGDRRGDLITFSEEAKRNCSLGQKKRFSKPEEVEKNRKAMRKAYSDPTLREKQKQLQKEFHEKNPEYRVKASKRTKEFFENNPERKDAHGKLMREKYQDPAYRAKMSKIQSGEEINEKRRKSMKEYCKNNPEYAEAQRQKILKQFSDPEAKAKLVRGQRTAGANKKAAKSVEFVDVLRSAFKQ